VVVGQRQMTAQCFAQMLNAGLPTCQMPTAERRSVRTRMLVEAGSVKCGLAECSCRGRLPRTRVGSECGCWRGLTERRNLVAAADQAPIVIGACYVAKADGWPNADGGVPKAEGRPNTDVCVPPAKEDVGDGLVPNTLGLLANAAKPLRHLIGTSA